MKKSAHKKVTQNKKLTNRTVDSYKIGEKVIPSFVVCEKVPNRKWQFWKPKYRGIFMEYIGRKS